MPKRKVTQVEFAPRLGDFGRAPTAKLRVAAYARVSTEKEEQEHSLEAQTDYFENNIKENPRWEFVGLYVDDGISGLSYHNRDGFNRMVADAVDGKIDLIITKSLSRFARNTGDVIMDNKSVIEKFNEKCAPFYLVDHDNGTFSLCYPFSFVDEKYRFYGQEAFDKYAERIGEPTRDERGFCTHGNGYEWAIVFNKYFENDRYFARLHTDSEAGGFFCYCDDLNLMVEVGLRFKNLIDDTYTFTKTVYSALEEDKIKQKAEIEYRKTMHYFLQNAPLADMILTTSEGEFLISEDQLKGLRDGKESIAFIGDYEMSAEEFGTMEIQSKHYDSNSRAYRVQADIPEEIIDEGMGGM